MLVVHCVGVKLHCSVLWEQFLRSLLITLGDSTTVNDKLEGTIAGNK